MLGVAFGLSTLSARTAAGQSASVQELIVTGSRLPRTDLIADSPIVTLDSEGLARSATLTLETALNRLPQVVPSYSSAANNPSANGAAYVNLRGLGSNRNLVLLDGRRGIGGNASNSVDLNTIPGGLVERVEVITGGASAVYGADAVAGVVNVILRKRFDGLELSGRTLVSGRGDGREHEASLVAGREVAGVSLMAAIGFAKREDVGKGARPFSSQAEGPTSFLPGGDYTTGGNQPSQAAIDAVFARYGVAAGAVSRRGGQAGFGFNADGTLFATGVIDNPAFDAHNYRGAKDDIVAGLYPDVYAYNFQPFNKLILPLERRSAALFATAPITDRLELYGQAIAVRYTASTALAPTPAPTADNPLYPGLGVGNFFTIPVTNPFIPPDLAQLLASRRGNSPALAGAGPGEEFLYRFRATALGARQSDNIAKTGQALAGARLNLGGDWRGEAFASYGRYERSETQDGLLSVRRFEQLLDSPTGGRDLCDGGFNPFGGALSASCREFLRVRASFRTMVQQTNAVASAAGPVFDAPAGPVLMVAGAEFREVRFAFHPPVGLSPNELAGFNPQNAVTGSIRFAELFGEASVPLLKDRPLARAADLTLGYRRSQERRTGGVDSWKAELGWAPTRELKLRGAIQRAVRAPDIFERYEPARGNTLTGIDPCASNAAVRTAQVLALCRRQAAALGFDPAVVDDFTINSNEVGVTSGGNPDLKPERATTFTLGAVWRPDWDSPWIGRVAATIDGYDIRVKGAIGYQDPQVALNGCYNIGGGNPGYDPANPFCRSLPRSSADFSLFQVPAAETNQVALETSGVDLSLAFRTDLAALGRRPWLGRLDTHLAASWLRRFDAQPSVAQPRLDYAGSIGGSSGYEALPRWKAQGTVGWTSGPVELGLSGRFIDSMVNRDIRLDPVGAASATGVGSTWYWDLSGRWDLGRRAQVRAGVLNLFDRGPELFKPAVDAGTDPSTYDVIGRRFWLGLTLRL